MLRNLIVNSLYLAAIVLSANAGAAAPANVNLPAFTVIGTEVRGSDKDMNAAIVTHWKRFMTEGMYGKIPGKIDKDVVALYHVYEPHPKMGGTFSFVLGARVEASAKAPSGMVRISVPASKYLQVNTEKGPESKIFGDAWKSIWGKNVTERKFMLDFEVHHPSTDPNQAQGEIFLSVK